jgi:hypothetical protein
LRLLTILKMVMKSMPVEVAGGETAVHPHVRG